MNNLLVISALGQDRAGLVAELSQTVQNSGCNIEDSRMSILGGEFAIIMLISGAWNNIAKLEDILPTTAEKLGLLLNSRRTQSSKRHINIHDMYTSCHRAAHTGSPMFTLSMTVEIPAATHISSLREQFMEFCDQLNLDAIMEPVKI
ncbi:MAG: ACT domain-containing protein [Gammaproteobacteria bacterium]